MNGDGGGGGSSVNGTNELNSCESNQQFSTMSAESNPSEGSMEFEDAMEQQPAAPHNGQLGKGYNK